VTNSEARHRVTTIEALLTAYVRPLVRKVIYTTIASPPALRPLFALAYDTQFVAREAFEFARRALVATPVFLSRCAAHGDRIAIDRVPYMTGPCHIELGSDVRLSGQISISASTRRGVPSLRIGNGVFIGHGTSFAIARRIELGNFVSIGAMTYIADTDGHARNGGDRPIWEVLATTDDIAGVIVEDGVQIGRGCMILKGVRIGARSIVGAGSVVRTDIPSDAIVMGNPARVVARTTPANSK
jgi:acetyltransferase-like isoleucine patch superfamily enzyme